jgi:hypothetical protein
LAAVPCSLRSNDFAVTVVTKCRFAPYCAGKIGTFVIAITVWAYRHQQEYFAAMHRCPRRPMKCEIVGLVQGQLMRRREFITLIGGTAAAQSGEDDSHAGAS